jgi:CHAT domain-containing protein
VCEVESLTLDPAVGSLRDALQRRLHDSAKRPPDIIHFTGHAITPAFGGTEILLPSLRQGEVDRLSIEVFASWVPRTVRLVVLSACQGISVETARVLHAAKSIGVLGFRCEVAPDAAAEFLENFYKAYLRERQPMAAAYRNACFMGNVAQFAWAAAVLLDHD